MNQRTEKILEFYLTHKEQVWSLVIVIGIIISIVCLLLISNEVYGAMSFCESTNGIYKMDYSSLTHTCDGSPIYNYHPDGWSYPLPVPIN